jgi:hypothetical protein
MKTYDLDKVGNLTITETFEQKNEAGEMVENSTQTNIGAVSLMSHLPLFIADIPLDIFLKVQAVIKAQNA